ncbi:DUF4870 domain-containing protein [Paraclostridium tenue]|uniref:DUF4870 domain-containing protein n=1 Tax=Paraclostridium tenue TaxID=1737 RepID=A0ABP3XEX6_9FIRM
MTDCERCTKNESTMMIVMTLAVMFFNIIGAIIVYVTCQVYGKQSAFIKRNGTRLIDFYISFVIYEIIVLLLCFVEVGKYLLPIMTLVYAVICIMAIIQYYKHKEFIYPLTLKILQKLK